MIFDYPLDCKFFLPFLRLTGQPQEQHIAGNVTYYVNYTLFPTVPRILGSCHYIFIFFTYRNMIQGLFERSSENDKKGICK